LGQRNQLAALVINDPRGRPEGLEPGEVVVWSAHGQKILLRADGGITISAPGKIDVAAPSVKVTAENVSINSPAVGVGKGTRKRVARIGDRVRVGSGSSAGLWPIVEGAEHMEAS
jgi:phage gp45-like